MVQRVTLKVNYLINYQEIDYRVCSSTSKLAFAPHKTKTNNALVFTWEHQINMQWGMCFAKEFVQNSLLLFFYSTRWLFYFDHYATCWDKEILKELETCHAQPPWLISLHDSRSHAAWSREKLLILNFLTQIVSHNFFFFRFLFFS